jgi:dihydrofolate synthase/folylpolyglutamate synthase
MGKDPLAWLDSLKELGMNAHLEKTATLLARLEMPQHAFPSIHVAGSNGKGTCCAILSNAFTLAGTCTGLFTSPHLHRVEERIRIDGVPITSNRFRSCLKRVRAAALRKPITMPTYFEATFLAAMVAFADRGVERAIIETGLGGRFDATRLVDADCCILTELALEHTDILGDTLAKIAYEKASIVRQGRPFIAAWTYDNEARAVIEDVVRDHSTAWWWRGDREKGIRFKDADEPYRPLPKNSAFDGWIPYKMEAAMLARNALWAMGEQKAYEAVDSAVTHTNWPGRMQWHEYEGVPLLLDAAHNPSGMARACEQIRFQKSRDEAPMPGVILVGCTLQNDLHAFLQPLVELIVEGEINHVFVTQPKDGRRPPMPCRALNNALREHGIDALFRSEEDPLEALEMACATALTLDEDTPPPVLCIGSLYLVGNILHGMGMDTPEEMSILIPQRGADDADPEA